MVGCCFLCGEVVIYKLVLLRTFVSDVIFGFVVTLFVYKVLFLCVF